MSVSVSTTAGNQVTVTVDGATQLSFTTEESSINVVNGDTSSISVTNQGPKGDVGPQGPQGETGAGVAAGGTENKFLQKNSATDYDTKWSAYTLPGADGTDGQVITTDGAGTLSFGKAVAEHVHLLIRNDEGTTINAGTPIYSKGEIGGSERILVGIADASDPSKMPAIGIAETTLNTTDAKDGYGIITGVFNTNVSGFTGLSEGDILYVSNSGGGLTQTKPTGTYLIQNVGIVLKTNGTILQGLQVSCIGRANDVPNIPNGQAWIGNASGVATPTTLATVATTGAYSDLSGTPTIPSGDVVDDTTPQLGGDLDVNGNKITSASNGNITIDPDGTGAIIMKSDDIQFDGGGVFGGQIKLYESDIVGSNFIGLKAPLSVTSDTTFELPNGDGTGGQALTTSGLGTLSWSDVIGPNSPTVNGVLSVEEGGADTGRIALYDIDGSNYVIVKAPDVISSNVIFVLPAADGSANQVLKTDGSGNLSFVDQTTDTNTNLGNSDLTLTAPRVVDMGSYSVDFQSGSATKFKIFNTGLAQGTGRFTVAGNGSAGGALRVGDASGAANIIALQHPNSGTGYNLKLPTADGSAGQVLKTDGSGNLSFGDRSNKITQVFNMNFFDDIATTKHYLPWKDINEQTLNYQDESAFLMPFDGRIVSVSLKITSLTGSGDITVGVETVPTGSNIFVGGSWTVEETETLSATATDDHHTFHFVFDNASHFEAGDSVALTMQTPVDIMGNSYIYVTAVVEWDTSSTLGSSSTEHESNP